MDDGAAPWPVLAPTWDADPGDVWEDAWDGQVHSQGADPGDAWAQPSALTLGQTLAPGGVGDEEGPLECGARKCGLNLSGASGGPRDDHLEQMRDLSARDVS